MNQRRIEVWAEKILSHITDNELLVPVPVEHLAQALGIRIKKAPSNDFSGLLLRKDGRAWIGVNDKESLVRQRFTIAHELGHFFLHKTEDAFVDYRDNKRGLTRNPKEVEANAFAAALLIPRPNLLADLKQIFQKGIFEADVEDLAKKYNVSKECMNYRILNLRTRVKK